MDGDRSDRKICKWQTAALEAAKQCGNPWLPEIGAVTPASAFMASAKGYDLKAVNPNARNNEDTRTPEELLDLIEAKGREVAQALSLLRK